MNFWSSRLKPNLSLEFQVKVVDITGNNKILCYIMTNWGSAQVLLCLILHSNKDSIKTGINYWKAHPSQQGLDGSQNATLKPSTPGVNQQEKQIALTQGSRTKTSRNQKSLLEFQPLPPHFSLLTCQQTVTFFSAECSDFLLASEMY